MKPKQLRRIQPRMKGLSRALRRRQTKAETTMWSALRGRRLENLKFRRQVPIGPYIVDFCSPGCKLVVEIDGDTHDETEAEDDVRSLWLRKQGYRVVRFTNDEVEGGVEGLLQEIVDAASGLAGREDVSDASHPHPYPLPNRERE